MYFSCGSVGGSTLQDTNTAAVGLLLGKHTNGRHEHWEGGQLGKLSRCGGGGKRESVT